MRFLVTVVSAGAALTFVAASGLMNWVFMTSLGKSELEQQILGAVSVAVSVFIALLPTLLVWAYRERRFIYILLGVPVFLAFAAFSLSSAVGFAAKNRGSLNDDRALANVRLTDLKQEIADAEAKLKVLGPVKPVSVLDAELRRLEQDGRWQSSKSCQDATADASRTFCKGYFDRQAEAGIAGEAAAQETRLAGLRSDMRRLEEQGAGRVSDNQAAHPGGDFGGIGGEGRAWPHVLPRDAGRNRRGPGAVLCDRAHPHPRPARRAPTAGQGAERHRQRHAAKESPPGKLRRAPVKQIEQATPRRVPRLGRG